MGQVMTRREFHEMMGLTGEKYKYDKAYEDCGWSLESFLENNEITEPTNEQLEWYARYTWDNSNTNKGYMTDTIFDASQWVNEMLSSVTFDMLYKQLNYQIGTGFRRGDKINQKGESKLLIPKMYWDDKEDEIRNLIDKYFWIITSIFTVNDIYEPDGEPQFVKVGKFDYVEIVLEPVLCDNVTKWVMDECGGKIYHITSQENLKHILKSGLRMKGEKNPYRMIKNKTYFVSGKDIHSVFKRVLDICKDKGLHFFTPNDDKRVGVVMVDLKKHKYDVSFFKDTFYEDEGMFYSYAYFPPTMIEDVTEQFVTQ